MVGKMKWNIYFAIGGMLVTFLFAWKSNLFLTALMRSLYAFVIFFVMMFFIRLIFSMIHIPEEGEDLDESQLGTHVDLSIPAVDPLQPLAQPKLNEENEHVAQVEQVQTPLESASDVTSSEQFQPIKPPKLASTESKTPQDLAAVVRQMSEGEGR